MRATRSLVVHFALLVGAAALAVHAWTRDKTSTQQATATADVVVWSGRSADVRRIQYETKNRKLTIEAHRDAAGRWFDGTVERETQSAPAASDAGVAPPSSKTVARIFSVKAVEKLADRFCPLKAIRNIGKIADGQLAEYGLNELQGTLTVTVGNHDHKLVFGGPTPGGADRYAKDPEHGEVLVISGDIARDLDGADASLNERDAHGFEDSEIQSLVVSAAGKTRKLLRQGPEGKRFWADPSSPEKPDDAAVTWMTKVDRLRPIDYPLAPPKPELSTVVLRLEYAGRSGSLGYLELVKVVPEVTAKPDFFIRSERIRLAAKVSQNAGEQVEQDVGSVVR